MRKKIRNKIMDDFNKSYDCRVTAEDIISKTNFFHLNPQTSCNTNYKFKVKYSYAFMYTLIIFLSLTICGLVGYNQYIKYCDYKNDTYISESILSEDEIAFINEIAMKSENHEYLKINIKKNSYLYIYKCYSKVDPTEYVYFYKMYFLHDIYEYTLYIDNQFIKIDRDNDFGILKDIKNSNINSDKLIFSIIDGDNKLDFSLNIGS